MAENMSDTICFINSSTLEIVDTISADYEDPISLDSFDSLIKAHYDAPPVGTRCFIIAQVATISGDNENEQKLHFSYYSAYGLNRVLFRTQSCACKKILRRLDVTNPLTNTPIYGEITYYTVNYDQGDGAGEDSVEYAGLRDHKQKQQLCYELPTPQQEQNDPPNASQYEAIIKRICMRLPFGKQKSSVSSEPSKNGSPSKLQSAAKVEDTSAIHQRIMDISAIYPDRQGGVPNIQRYMALSVATDKGYLESLKVREIFLENAISKEDVHLYEIGEGYGVVTNVNEDEDNTRYEGDPQAQSTGSRMITKKKLMGIVVYVTPIALAILIIVKFVETCLYIGSSR